MQTKVAKLRYLSSTCMMNFEAINKIELYCHNWNENSRERHRGGRWTNVSRNNILNCEENSVISGKNNKIPTDNPITSLLSRLCGIYELHICNCCLIRKFIGAQLGTWVKETTQYTQILTPADESWHWPVIESIGQMVAMEGTLHASAIIWMEKDIRDDETGALYTNIISFMNNLSK